MEIYFYPRYEYYWVAVDEGEVVGDVGIYKVHGMSLEISLRIVPLSPGGD